MIVDNCWRCKGTARPETFADSGRLRWRVRCLGSCGAVGLSSLENRLAVKWWNDEQKDLRRTLTDTELLQSPPGAMDKLREDEP